MSLGAGVLNGLIVAGVMISLAALIFAGPLAAFLSNGIGLMLIGLAVMGVVLAALSASPASIAVPQDAPAVIVAVTVAGVAASMEGAAPAATYATVAATIVLTSLATAATYLLLGQFRLGALARYLPYPVVGGFLAGTGWLMVAGGVAVMAGVSPALATLPTLLQPSTLGQWLPGALFGLATLVTLRRLRHPLVLPALIIAATALFYGWLTLSGVSVAEAMGRGWLLGPFPERAAWAPLTPELLAQVRWPAIVAQAGGIAAAVLISVVGLLLNVSGLQLALRADIDLNRELRAMGAAQLAAGLVGSPPGFQALSPSVLAHAMGARAQLVGVGMAGVSALVLLFGADLLALIPRPVLGGILVFLGLGFLAEWLVDTWPILPRLDYAMVLAIMVLIATFGMLAGVAAGLALAVTLFVIAYSRIDVVKHTLSGATIKSRMTRSPAAQAFLRDHGEQIAIFTLQGFIFFGTAHEIYDRVRRRALAASQPRLRFVLLDFRLVPKLDSTALLSFTKLLQLAEAEGLTLAFTQLTPAIRGQLARGLLKGGESPHVRIFPDQDHGLEWCEEQLLAAAGPPAEAGELRVLLARLAPEGADLDELLGAFERRSFEPGEYLMRRGEAPDTMLLIEAGQVTAQIVGADGSAVRLESMGAGRLVGELGFFLGSRRTADVLADTAGTLHRITRDGLRRLEEERPALASALHLISARLLSERVIHLMGTVDALQR